MLLPLRRVDRSIGCTPSPASEASESSRGLAGELALDDQEDSGVEVADSGREFCESSTTGELDPEGVWGFAFAELAKLTGEKISLTSRRVSDDEGLSETGMSSCVAACAPLGDWRVVVFLRSVLTCDGECGRGCCCGSSANIFFFWLEREGGEGGRAGREMGDGGRRGDEGRRRRRVRTSQHCCIIGDFLFLLTMFLFLCLPPRLPWLWAVLSSISQPATLAGQPARTEVT